MRSPLRARLVASLALIAATPALAFDFVPTRYDDPAPDGCLATDCSLREALIAANAGQDLDRVLLSAGTYELSIANVAGNEDLGATGDLDLTSNLEIVGPGATMTTIDANGLDRVLDFQELSAPDAPSVTVRGIRITGGSDDGPSAFRQFRNAAILEECEIVGNGSIAGINAVDVSLFGTLTLRRTTIAENGTGGVFANSSTITLENSTLSGNAGIAMSSLNGGTVSARQSTIFGTATNTEASATGTNSKVQLENTILVGSCFTGTGGSIVSSNGNIEAGSITCGIVQSQDIMNASVVLLDLSALGDAGGPTRVRIPGVNSSAVSNALDATCLATDQRGVARAADCESGSVERTSAHVETPIFIDGFLQGGPGAWSDVVGAAP